MKNFEKHLVRNNQEVDGWMRFAIGGSWDYIQNKYPLVYPAILIIGGDGKEYEYVYESDFDSKLQLIDYGIFQYCKFNPTGGVETNIIETIVDEFLKTLPNEI